MQTEKEKDKLIIFLKKILFLIVLLKNELKIKKQWILIFQVLENF